MKPHSKTTVTNTVHSCFKSNPLHFPATSHSDYQGQSLDYRSTQNWWEQSKRSCRVIKTVCNQVMRFICDLHNNYTCSNRARRDVTDLNGDSRVTFWSGFDRKCFCITCSWPSSVILAVMTGYPIWRIHVFMTSPTLMSIPFACACYKATVGDTQVITVLLKLMVTLHTTSCQVSDMSQIRKNYRAVGLTSVRKLNRAVWLVTPYAFSFKYVCPLVKKRNHVQKTKD